MSRTFRLAALVAAVVAMLAVAVTVSAPAGAHTARAATYTPRQCYYGPGGGGYSYKYSGLLHVEPSTSPSWPDASKIGKAVISTQYWNFANTGDHILVYYTIENRTGTYWIQVGLMAGYDPWGNKINTNYPLGSWTNSHHPNGPGGPVYTPNGTWGLLRYAEFNIPSGYTFQSISDNFGLSAGQTVYAATPSAGHFSIRDQDGHDLGVASNVAIPSDSSLPGYAIGIAQESMNNGANVQAQCSFGDFNVQGFTSSDNNTSFWGFYDGCSNNGWNSNNTSWGGLDNQVNGVANGTHPACNGGQASQNAPLDISIGCTSGGTCAGNWTIVELYMAETLIGGGGQIVANTAPEPAAGWEPTLAPGAKKPDPKTATAPTRGPIGTGVAAP